VDGLSVPDSRARPPSYNVAPSQELYVIRQNHKTGERTLDLLRWGLIPHGCKDPSGGRKPINARAESVASLPTFRVAYAKRRCIVGRSESEAQFGQVGCLIGLSTRAFEEDGCPHVPMNAPQDALRISIESRRMAVGARNVCLYGCR
jgi:hypothetical protein